MHCFSIVKVIILNERGELLALKRPEGVSNRPGQWDIPGGSVEAGEELLAAARRETQEEAGLTLSVSDLQLVYGTSEVRTDASGTWLIFLARVPGHPAIKLSVEHTEYAWLTVAELRSRIVYGLHQRVFDYLDKNDIIIPS